MCVPPFPLPLLQPPPSSSLSLSLYLSLHLDPLLSPLLPQPAAHVRGLDPSTSPPNSSGRKARADDEPSLERGRQHQQGRHLRRTDFWRQLGRAGRERVMGEAEAVVVVVRRERRNEEKGKETGGSSDGCCRRSSLARGRPRCGSPTESTCFNFRRVSVCLPKFFARSCDVVVSFASRTQVA